MNYFIKRGEEKFGPYTLADLQRYVQSGNIALGDLAQSEGMTDWVPVSQVIGNVPVPAAASGAAAVPAAQPTVPLPPNLHWALVLVLAIVTCGLFSLVWGFIQATWAKKLEPENKAVWFMLGYVAAIVLAVGLSVNRGGESLAGFVNIGGIVCYIIGCFSVKSAMESYYTTTENIGLSLSGVMTFFFNITYLQYHINRIVRWKQTGVLS